MPRLLTDHLHVRGSADAQRAAFEGIERSHCYFCLLTPAFLRDAQCLAQAAYAVALGKPFAVIRQPGLDLPEDFEGATIIVSAEVDFDGDPLAVDAALACVAKQAAEALGMR